MAKRSGQDGNSTPANSDPGDAQVSPDLESQVQNALDDAFGGTDQATLEREAPAGDQGDQGEQDAGGSDAADGERTTTVRSHQRRVRSRRRTQDDGDGWQEDAHDPIHQDEGEEGQDEGEGSGEADQGGQQAAEPESPTPDQNQPGEQNQEGDIPTHLIEAARRRGWTDDRIQRLVQADPEAAYETFEQLHQDANELSRRFAELGRTMRGQQPPHQTGQPAPHQQPGQPPFPGQPQPQPALRGEPNQAPGGQFGQPYPQQPPAPGQQGPFQQQPPQPGQQPGQAQPQGNALLPEFSFPQEVLEGLDDEFKKGILDRVQNHMNQINQVVNHRVAQHDQFIQERQQEALTQQIDGFFDGQGAFKDTYGSGQKRSEITNEQMENRIRVVEEADAIRAGAMSQGRQLSVQDALDMAHNLVTSNQQRQAARREVQGQVQRRGQQATVRPTHRKGPAGGSSNDPLSKAEQTANRKLREMNGASSRR